MKRTARGFSIYTEFNDHNGQEVRVQESSEAFHKRCWIFCTKDGLDCHVHLGTHQAYSPYLTPAQARMVARALLRFADSK